MFQLDFIGNEFWIGLGFLMLVYVFHSISLFLSIRNKKNASKNIKRIIIFNLVFYVMVGIVCYAVRIDMQEKNVYDNLSITIEATSSKDPLEAIVHIVNNGRSDIGWHQVQFVPQVGFPVIVPGHSSVHFHQIEHVDPMTSEDTILAGGDELTNFNLKDVYKAYIESVNPYHSSQESKNSPIQIIPDAPITYASDNQIKDFGTKSLKWKRVYPDRATLVVVFYYRLKSRPWISKRKPKNFMCSLVNGIYKWSGQPTNVVFQ